MVRKKIVALGLSVALVACVLTGCGNGGNQAGESSAAAGENSAADNSSTGQGEAAENTATEGT